MGTNARGIDHFGLAVAAELRAAIARADLTQREVSEGSGVPLATLNKTLKGNRVADVDDLYAIAAFLRISPAAILTQADHALAAYSDDENIGADELPNEA